MKVVYSKYNIALKLSEEYPCVLVVEAKEKYSEICYELWKQSEGHTGNVLISKNGKELQLSKNVAVVFNPFALNCNDKKITTKLYKEMTEIATESFYEESSKIQSLIVDFLDKICLTSQYPLSFKTELDIGELFKLFGVIIEDDSNGLLEKILNYFKIMHQICNTEVFVTIGLKNYLSDEQIKKLYKEILYEKIYLLDLESMFDAKLLNEKVTILDKDLCIININ